MKPINFKIKSSYLTHVKKVKFTWESPSNIALIKYWGKKDLQIPANPSLSFTLNKCTSTTTLEVFKKDTKSQDISFEVYLDGKTSQRFRPKIQIFLERVLEYIPFVADYHFVIHTSNSFPHSSGIASSASGMSALSLGLMSLEETLTGSLEKHYFIQKASFLARLGSGSACRSIEGPIISWGVHEDIKDSSDIVGTSYKGKLAPIFADFQDTILLVDQGEKQISSTLGHQLMENHPFAKSRFEQANKNISILLNALEEGNLNDFIKIVESEALTLHSMMMTSEPYFLLMAPNTLAILHKIWTYRTASSIPICFTLDAGANVHLLYPKAYTENVRLFIDNELLAYCQNNRLIHDCVGNGAKKH